ncbi:cell division protein FtsH [Candidatus Falkowbacteria bacterium RIFOXYB2_FULL_34_18]|uniref:ATP-dependent zinc metalloprotease FtsH n=1 Tax=Candidatus Falkowbacteria bacterium RIFOXYD2_FULL_34_120 TaxID=1798007 RepID=A0A1F5TQX8_9BACT|nr:MAG: cell division protein FtsH [Candidatus Falkowbacteria bacterium RIFOXYB2_FULL_34_18]OGF29446.1 MAG: cell division protein FtsH [Candidatus Falkowbacteria bacterium RIFOXYC12_FULL_34_55]OGF36759.1 MAG: cell division protein FtsH [Candidatus Falkowbacteria bacterium RIFOXYC2_FULL_34_220]OGF38972.1 MAG: cell division protein FtsH [Candidatus Falkowbacteria bacterium RIFOXYD12_FULL_34_57]OGF41164.1 MAG: cell division protein FtsH [Candidatus Falkowbacteria bacterium RIFOXYD2_FULL_34_120]
MKKKKIGLIEKFRLLFWWLKINFIYLISKKQKNHKEKTTDLADFSPIKTLLRIIRIFFVLWVCLWLFSGIVSVFHKSQKTNNPVQKMEFVFYTDFIEIIKKFNPGAAQGELIHNPYQKTFIFIEHPKLVEENIKIYQTTLSKETSGKEIETLIELAKNKNIAIGETPKPQEGNFLLSLFISWIPMLILIAVWIFFMKKGMGGGSGGVSSFGKSQANIKNNNQDIKKFKDVAGIEEVKEEVEEVVKFLKDPYKFSKLGARIPKGILLVGKPGTGKTLLAQAVAGEAGVPFFSISGSSFVEMFVGVGASRVRDLFAHGKKHAPCIIFIDEIDAVGRQRGAGLGGGHDEREQTLNQLLVEMDGFSKHTNIIIMAATNRADILDPALLRPGRFDRKIYVPMPNVSGREFILKVHTQDKLLSSDVNFKELAKGTPGFSGADLENLANEAALIATKKDHKKITMKDFEDAKDKVYMGLEKKDKAIKPEERKITAYHEAGHALVARLLPFTDTVNKISIVPRGQAAGVTWFLPEESMFKYKDQLENELSVAYGGRAAEEIIFKRISTGASNDIKQATKVAEQMVCSLGMSEKLGLRSYSKDQNQIFLGKEIGQNKEYSEATAQIIDEEIKNILDKAYEQAKKILNDNLDVLHALAELLLEKETIMGHEMDELIKKTNIQSRLYGDEKEKE